MAELSAADRKSILGPNYKEPEVTEASLAHEKVTKRASMRNWAIAVAIGAFLVLALIIFRS